MTVANQAQNEGAAPPDGPTGESSKPARPVTEPEEPKKPADDDQADEVIELHDRYVPGSAQTIGAAELERFERDNVHQILSVVPGVYIREEDGYGLRPNIGMRGSGSERSAKIALMEDGVLVAPAPYSAPAAYYFPLMTRMEQIDVLKGPAAIEYGPNTVGGAINMHSKPVPWRSQGELDAALGSYDYRKLHGNYGYASRHFGLLVEGVRLQTDGFKVLDNGASTGFAKDDVQLKMRVNGDRRGASYHQLDIKLGYADEVSNETYTGLAESDFEATPYRRYAATQLDQMDWRHLRGQVDYRAELGAKARVVVTAYRNEFNRSWHKLNRFYAGLSIDEVLANPTSGNNAVFYAILRGEADTTSEAERLSLGTNQRAFVSQGIQGTGRLRSRLLAGRSTLDVGVRLHYDEIVRHHSEASYDMFDGVLVLADPVETLTRDETHSALALASYVREKWERGRFAVTAGTRTELIFTEAVHRVAPPPGLMDGTGENLVLIPGAGVVYRPESDWELLLGVHRGFVPVAPGQAPEVEPETSINYEAGARYAAPGRAFEFIGFFSDYSNLKASCASAIGCTLEQLGREYNAGSVHVFGVEAAGTWAVPITARIQAPLRVSYTFNHSRLLEEFTSANPLYGQVEPGDELPYLPRHQLSMRAGIAHRAGHVTAQLSYVSSMRDMAGQGPLADDPHVDGYMVIDVAAGYAIRGLGQLYVTVDNILDEAYMVSRRPVGVRPGKPRLFVLGYKNKF